ncbi:hypothetical protein TRFO_22333 [Tritrichomonas foetus]|uniref:Uncharacterized protein n=1 Tax=Tritrichomonas foetus TaxID=1144522 RepID=A0A1J4KBY9_9EUKA|nr:hypothetical protein TRFO_22333 [Tritrichomonas foetus]|eukprot:OHT08927.1 hypothetical protein TRFO_22333 [Tritrichomonas foetus]
MVNLLAILFHLMDVTDWDQPKFSSEDIDFFANTSDILSPKYHPIKKYTESSSFLYVIDKLIFKVETDKARYFLLGRITNFLQFCYSRLRVDFIDDLFDLLFEQLPLHPNFQENSIQEPIFLNQNYFIESYYENSGYHYFYDFDSEYSLFRARSHDFIIKYLSNFIKLDDTIRKKKYISVLKNDGSLKNILDFICQNIYSIPAPSQNTLSNVIMKVNIEFLMDYVEQTNFDIVKDFATHPDPVLSYSICKNFLYNPPTELNQHFFEKMIDFFNKENISHNIEEILIFLQNNSSNSSIHNKNTNFDIYGKDMNGSNNKIDNMKEIKTQKERLYYIYVKYIFMKYKLFLAFTEHIGSNHQNSSLPNCIMSYYSKIFSNVNEKRESSAYEPFPEMMEIVHQFIQFEKYTLLSANLLIPTFNSAKHRIFQFLSEEELITLKSAAIKAIVNKLDGINTKEAAKSCSTYLQFVLPSYLNDSFIMTIEETMAIINFDNHKHNIIFLLALKNFTNEIIRENKVTLMLTNILTTVIKFYSHYIIRISDCDISDMISHKIIISFTQLFNKIDVNYTLESNYQTTEIQSLNNNFEKPGTINTPMNNEAYESKDTKISSDNELKSFAEHLYYLLYAKIQNLFIYIQTDINLMKTFQKYTKLFYNFVVKFCPYLNLQNLEIFQLLGTYDISLIKASLHLMNYINIEQKQMISTNYFGQLAEKCGQDHQLILLSLEFLKISNLEISSENDLLNIIQKWTEILHSNINFQFDFVVQITRMLGFTAFPFYSMMHARLIDKKEKSPNRFEYLLYTAIAQAGINQIVLNPAGDEVFETLNILIEGYHRFLYSSVHYQQLKNSDFMIRHSKFQRTIGQFNHENNHMQLRDYDDFEVDTASAARLIMEFIIESLRMNFNLILFDKSCQYLLDCVKTGILNTSKSLITLFQLVVNNLNENSLLNWFKASIFCLSNAIALRNNHQEELEKVITAVFLFHHNLNDKLPGFFSESNCKPVLDSLRQILGHYQDEVSIKQIENLYIDFVECEKIDIDEKLFYIKDSFKKSFNTDLSHRKYCKIFDVEENILSNNNFPLF